MNSIRIVYIEYVTNSTTQFQEENKVYIIAIELIQL